MDITRPITPSNYSEANGASASNGAGATRAAGPASGGSGSTGFSQVLNQVQSQPVTISSGASVGRWSSLNFLNTVKAPRFEWPWTQTSLNLNVDPAIQRLVENSTPISRAYRGALETVRPAELVNAGGEIGAPMALSEYPHPAGDNGRGIHWIPTVSQSPEVVDQYVNEAVAMGMKWVVFLNDGAHIGDNDYLVKKLTQADIEPVMRIYTSGVVPVEGDLKEAVEHYTQLGVHYVQLYNEPNLQVETNGQPADVDTYLDLWTAAAKEVIAGGGLPGFGALSPQGEMDDRTFLKQALQGLKDRGQENLLNQGWLAMHNYTGPRPLNDPDGFKRFVQYNDIINQVLGRSIPIVGTEGGTHITSAVSEEQQINMVTGAYNYMRHREPYNFAYTYWIIANGHDSAWDEHAIFRADGPTALAQALKSMAGGATTGGLV